MNDFGWYVHHSFLNYLIYSTNYPVHGGYGSKTTGGLGIAEAQQAINNFRNRTIQQAGVLGQQVSSSSEDLATLQEMEDFINYFYNGLDVDEQTGEIAQAKSEITDFFDTLLQDFIHNAIDTALDVDLNTLTPIFQDGTPVGSPKLYDKQKVTRTSDADRHALRKPDNPDGTPGDVIKKDEIETANLSQLQDKLDELVQNITYQRETVGEITQAQKEALIKAPKIKADLLELEDRYFEEYKNRRKKKMSKEKWEKLDSKKEKWRKVGHRSYAQVKANYQTLLDEYREVQELLNSAKIFPAAAAKLQGAVGEMLPMMTIAAVQTVLDMGVTGSLKEAFTKAMSMNGFKENMLSHFRVVYNDKDIWAGSQKPSYKLNRNNFSKIIQDNVLIEAKTSITQGMCKLDVGYNFKVNNVKASVKNINTRGSRGLHLEASHRTLLFHLQEDSLFTAHFLNLTAAHPYMNVQETQFSKVRLEAINALRLKLIFDALTGYGGKKSQMANVLYVHDTNSSRGGHNITIVPVDVVIDKVVQLLNMSKAKVGIINYITKDESGSSHSEAVLPDNLAFANNWHGPQYPNLEGAKDRWLDLLKQLHVDKTISINLSPNATRQILYS